MKKDWDQEVNNFKDTIKEELGKSFRAYRESTGQITSEISYTSLKNNYLVKVNFVNGKQNFIETALYKRRIENLKTFKRVKANSFSPEHRSDIIKELRSYKKEIELQELFTN